VHLGSNRSGALAALTIAVALSGCANIDFDSSQAWFAKPFDAFGRSGGFTYSELQEARKDRPISANDLVDGNGGCAAVAAPAQPASAPGIAGGSPPVSPDAPSVLGEAIALGMSECDVVRRAGQPAAVQLGRNPNGDRTALVTFNGGPRPGIYRFEAGRLMEMDRVEQPPAPPPLQAAKKKPAKPAQAQKKNDQT
jgi:hypothetical protein